MNSPDRRPESRLDHELEQRSRQLYRQAAQQLDPNTAGQLRAARRAALRSADAPRWPLARWLIPTGAFAVVTLATLMVWQPTSPHRANPALQASNAADLDSDLPPDADQTDPTLYQNLDFYGWLAANTSKPTMRRP